MNNEHTVTLDESRVSTYPIWRTLSEVLGKPAQWREWLRQWKERAQERRELMEFEDRMLVRDLAISRVDALQESRKPFWKK